MSSILKRKLVVIVAVAIVVIAVVVVVVIVMAVAVIAVAIVDKGTTPFLFLKRFKTKSSSRFKNTINQSIAKPPYALPYSMLPYPLSLLSLVPSLPPFSRLTTQKKATSTFPTFPSFLPFIPSFPSFCPIMTRQ